MRRPVALLDIPAQSKIGRGGAPIQSEPVALL